MPRAILSSPLCGRYELSRQDHRIWILNQHSQQTLYNSTVLSSASSTALKNINSFGFNPISFDPIDSYIQDRQFSWLQAFRPLELSTECWYCVFATPFFLPCFFLSFDSSWCNLFWGCFLFEYLIRGSFSGFFFNDLSGRVCVWIGWYWIDLVIFWHSHPWVFLNFLF